MNQNNSSSAYTDELLSIDDYQDINYGKDLQKLKCENFQLRLMCYNYENTLSELECNPNNENEVGNLKKSFCKKLEKVNDLEEIVKQMQKENSHLRKQLEEYSEINNSYIKPCRDDETQINLECLECKELEKNNEKALNTLTLQMKCLENVNLDLQTTLKDKPETFEMGCITENILSESLKSLIISETDVISEMESEIPQSKTFKLINLKVIYEKAVKSLNKFLNFYNEGEIHMADLEKEIMSALQLESNNESVIDEKYKINLFKEETPNWEKQYLNDIMLKCHNKIIDDDIGELILFDDVVTQLQKKSQPSLRNPNILTIKSFIEKLNESSNKKRLMRLKIQHNQNWEKQFSKTVLPIIEINSLKGLSEEFDIHMEKVTDIMSIFAKLIPVMQSTFTKTIARLASTQYSSVGSNINYNSDYYQNFIKHNHENNKRMFVDKCNLFIKVTSDCILSLNKEKMFLNHTQEIFNSVNNEQIRNENNLEIDIEDTKVLKQDQTNENDNGINYSPGKIINYQSNKVDHIKSNVDLYTNNSVNEIYIDVTEIEINTNDNTNKTKNDNRINCETFSIDNGSQICNELDGHQVNVATRLINKTNSLLSNELNYCIFVCKSINNHNSETQTNCSDFNNQNKNLNKIKRNKLEININLCDLEKTSITKNSENDEKLITENQELISYSNQSHHIYDIVNRSNFPVKKYDNIINEYLSIQTQDMLDNNIRKCFSLSSEILSKMNPNQFRRINKCLK